MLYSKRSCGAPGVFVVISLLSGTLLVPSQSAAFPGPAGSPGDSIPDSIAVQTLVRGVEGLRIQIGAQAYEPDSNEATTLTQTNNTAFLTGLSSAIERNPAQPSIILQGTPGFTQSGTYTINWAATDDSLNVSTATTTLIVTDLTPPIGLQAYYADFPRGTPIQGNATGVINYVIWEPSTAESAPFGWNGYRVRRTIRGVTPSPLQVAGQYTNVIETTQGTLHIPTSPLCFNPPSPCIPDSFVFLGNGLFFRGFRGNAQPGGGFVLDYPRGAPQDSCSSCWVFVDLGALSGFTTDYSVTTIGPFDGNDYVESPLNESAVVTLTPSTSPPADLERVAVVPNPYKQHAEWDPAVGEGRVRFIHVPSGSTVRIFTTNVELVRELTLDSASSPGGVTGDVVWDLRNGRGNKVVSGIYVYQVETPEGRTRKGHFVIIK